MSSRPDADPPIDIAAKRSTKRRAVRLSERAERQLAERQRLKNRLPPKRERMTAVERLRRRAAASDKPLVVGHHGSASNPTSGPNSRHGSPEVPQQNETFRLVCWNIEDGIDIDGTIDGLTSNPHLANAGAICLQEMDSSGVERIASELGLNYVYLESSNDERTERGFGNAVLSPHPLTNCRPTPLPHVAKAYGRPRAAVSTTILWPTADGPIPVSVWSIHAEIPSLSLTKRVAQYTAAAAKATAPNPAHVLLAGDFNTTTITSVVALDDLYTLFDLDRLTYHAGPSLRRAGKLFYLDHIYGRGLRVVATGVEREVIASDHWPIWVDAEPINLVS